MAQVNAETGFFKLSQEKQSKYKSGTSFYKGRGLIQLTGNLNKDGTAYDDPGPYEDYGKYLADHGYLEKGKEGIFITNPDLISKDLHYAIDIAGWEWEVFKRVSKWEDKDYDSAKIREVKAWKRERFSKGLDQSLNRLALVMEESGEEENYFWLQSKILNGYSPDHKDKPDPHGWEKRKEGLIKLKAWFKYDKAVCKGEKELKLDTGNRAPWMLFAEEELKKYGGIRQNRTPLKERVIEYFRTSKDTWDNEKGYWCGAFVRWCFAQTTDYNYVFDSYDSVTAFNWLSSEHKTNKGIHSKRSNDVEAILNIKDIFVGAIIIFSYSHVAFVLGQSEDEKLIYYLGGNQSDKTADDGPGKRTICIGKISKSKMNSEFWLSKPKNYTPTNEDKQLPKLNVSAYTLDYTSTR
ncbi:hypothetical protein [Apibacter sp. ESL0404]|uniref:hypothetical protein n=1 Tax=Apibacter sp. ESL0404 TaxID=2704651 RepID=UPI001C6A7623|nr:hypothetical protein [Apibacter sp. ESL0404]QYN51802.1 hypothetical protein GYM72_09805 [Apibacter sp. ESL0404]